MKESAPKDASEKELILLVEDNRTLRDGLALNLRLHNYRVLTALDGETGLQLALDKRPDLIVLDIMLPKISGLEVLRTLRKNGEKIPVLILSARGTTSDKVAGLNLGADDYLNKPFDLPELLARIGAMLRRQRNEEQQPALKLGDMVIVPSEQRVRVRGRVVEMSAREFALLHLLASAPGKVFTRETILQRVWGWEYEGTARTVDNFVASLRKKIEPDPASPVYLRTVPRLGYRIEIRENHVP